MAQVTVARGAALAAAASTEFTDEQLLVATVGEPALAPARPRKFSYAGAVTALAAGAITFVTSLSLAVGLQLAPGNASGTAKHPVHTSSTIEPPVEAAVAPRAALPAPRKAAQSASQEQLPVGPTAEPGAQPAAPVEQQNATSEAESDPNGRPPGLTRVLEHIPGAYGDSPPQP